MTSRQIPVFLEWPTRDNKISGAGSIKASADSCQQSGPLTPKTLRTFLKGELPPIGRCRSQWRLERSPRQVQDPPFPGSADPTLGKLHPTRVQVIQLDSGGFERNPGIERQQV